MTVFKKTTTKKACVFDPRSFFRKNKLFLCPWNSPGKNGGVDCYCLLQGIFLTQGLNLGLLHCRQILLHGRLRSSEPPGKTWNWLEIPISILAWRGSNGIHYFRIFYLRQVYLCPYMKIIYRRHGNQDVRLWVILVRTGQCNRFQQLTPVWPKLQG